uniref:Formate/nitrite transporter n=1 Tax=Entomoneis paludosa TaxID=265537 RepID=A0A6U3AKI1_9STRA
MCNWMVSLAVFLGGATNDLVGKLVAVWFPISTFVAIGLEHSVANLFLMPAAMLLNASMSWGDIIFRNVLPVLAGNAVAGALVVAASYSYQFGGLGGKRRAIFAEKLAKRERRKTLLKVRETVGVAVEESSSALAGLAQSSKNVVNNMVETVGGSRRTASALFASKKNTEQ